MQEQTSGAILLLLLSVPGAWRPNLLPGAERRLQQPCEDEKAAADSRRKGHFIRNYTNLSTTTGKGRGQNSTLTMPSEHQRVKSHWKWRTFARICHTSKAHSLYCMKNNLHLSASKPSSGRPQAPFRLLCKLLICPMTQSLIYYQSCIHSTNISECLLYTVQNTRHSFCTGLFVDSPL